MALRRSRFLRALGGLAIVLLLIAHDLGWRRMPTLAAVDRQLYDGRQALLQARLDPRIVIVDIDERSLAEQGRWPWPRERVAALVDAIATRGRAAVSGFDTVFAEPQRDGDGDARLSASLREGRAVLGYYLTSDRSARRTGTLPMPVFDGEAASLLELQMVHADGYGANLEQFGEAAAGQGFFNAFLGAGIDVDGTVRAMPLLAAYGNDVHESFGVAILRQYLGAAALIAEPDRLKLRGVRGEVAIPVSVGYTAMVPFAGRGGAAGGRFRYVSASDVLKGEVDWSVMRNRIVLIGTSAPGLTDLRATPVSEVFPGVEIHASFIAGALDGDIKRRPPEAGVAAALASLTIGGGLAVLLPALGPIGTALASALALLTLLGTSAIAYSNAGLVLPVAAPVVAVLGLMVFNLLFGYLAEGRARRAVLKLFGEYVSPSLVEQMARDPVRWRVAESVNRELTMLFADIRGFTRMAESMDPAALREYLNTVLTGLTGVIHEYGGTVDKYIGDAVMAFWGAPVDDPMHADNAVSAAIAIQEEARRLSADFVMRGLPPLSIGIGVNTGLVRVGDMGSTLRRTYTVIGDAVNLAARFEGLTKRYNVRIIVGEQTVRGCRDTDFDELAQVDIDGRSDSVLVFVPRPALDGKGARPRRVRAEQKGTTGEAARSPQAARDRDRRATGGVHEATSPRV